MRKTKKQAIIPIRQPYGPAYGAGGEGEGGGGGRGRRGRRRGRGGGGEGRGNEEGIMPVCF